MNAEERAMMETWERGGFNEDGRRQRGVILCPECGDRIWDKPHGHKLAKCWNTTGHKDGGTLAFDTTD